MNYEEKYKQALERASKLRVQNPFDTVGQMVEHIFPELKESEDGENKRISKEITQFLKQNNGWNREWLAWLEKQCQVKESIISQHEIEMCKENDNSLTGENERIKETLKEFVKGYSAFINGQWRLGDFTVNRLIAWLEKQGEHKPYGQRKECEDCQFNYAGECKGLCKMKRDEQKPADEDEPKFRPGDIVQYITDSTDRRRIEEIDTLCNMYHTDSSPIMFEVEDEWKVVVNAEDVEQESVDKVDFEKKELKKIESKTLDPDKVIAWLNDQACQGWIEDVEVDKFVAKFKQDFGL